MCAPPTTSEVLAELDRADADAEIGAELDAGAVRPVGADVVREVSAAWARHSVSARASGRSRRATRRMARPRRFASARFGARTNGGNFTVLFHRSVRQSLFKPNKALTASAAMLRAPPVVRQLALSQQLCERARRKIDFVSPSTFRELPKCSKTFCLSLKNWTRRRRTRSHSRFASVRESPRCGRGATCR